MYGLKFKIGTTVYDTVELGLILTDYYLEPPKPKTYYVDVEGMDGELDLSESLGALRYESRRMIASFGFGGDHEAQLEKNAQLLSLLHGKRAEITQPIDDGYHLLGRLEVSEPTHKRGAMFININALCHPYRTNGTEEVL